MIPGSGRFPGEGNGNPLQYSCLENPVDGGAWTWGCKESDTTEQLHFLSFTFFCNTSENLRILSVRHVRQLQLTSAADPTDTLTAISWEMTLSQNDLAKPLLDSWPINTVRDKNVFCCFKPLSLEIICYVESKWLIHIQTLY